MNQLALRRCRSCTCPCDARSSFFLPRTGNPPLQSCPPLSRVSDPVDLSFSAQHERQRMTIFDDGLSVRVLKHGRTRTMRPIVDITTWLKHTGLVKVEVRFPIARA